MTGRGCQHEHEVVHAIIDGAWPAAVDRALREHAAACPFCGAAVDLATLLRDDRAEACEDAHVPTAAAAWWKAQLRARQEASRAVGRPISAFVGIALASLAGLFAAVVPAVRTWGPAWLGYAGRLLAAVRLPATEGATASGSAMASISPLAMTFWIGILVWLIVAPLALYFVFADD